MSSYPISVCMIAKNEEKYIEECLKHLMPYQLEIIVADTGSTDRTKEIAQKYTDKVYDFTWVEDFSAARNFCAEKAANDWILVIDCDEYIENLDLNRLSSYMKQPQNVGEICIRNMVHRNNGETTYLDSWITRFYHRKFYHFAYPVHENIVPLKKLNRILFQAPVQAIHYGYHIEGDAMKEKQTRNLNLLYQALDGTQDDRKGYLCFQIGQSEQTLGNMDTAIEYYEKCLELEKDITLRYMNTCIIQLATAYASADKPQKAVELMENYKDTLKNARFVYYYGLALLGTEDFLKALVQLVLATTLPDRDSLGEDLMYCYEYIIKIYTMFGEEQMAEDFRKRYEECCKKEETK